MSLGEGSAPGGHRYGLHVPTNAVQLPQIPHVCAYVQSSEAVGFPKGAGSEGGTGKEHGHHCAEFWGRTAPAGPDQTKYSALPSSAGPGATIPSAPPRTRPSVTCPFCSHFRPATTMHHALSHHQPGPGKSDSRLPDFETVPLGLMSTLPSLPLCLGCLCCFLTPSFFLLSRLLPVRRRLSAVRAERRGACPDASGPMHPSCSLPGSPRPCPQVPNKHLLCLWR